MRSPVLLECETHLNDPEPIPKPLPQGDREILPVYFSKHILGVVVAVEVATDFRPSSNPADSNIVNARSCTREQTFFVRGDGSPEQ